MPWIPVDVAAQQAGMTTGELCAALGHDGALYEEGRARTHWRDWRVRGVPPRGVPPMRYQVIDAAGPRWLIVDGWGWSKLVCALDLDDFEAWVCWRARRALLGAP